MTIGRNAASPYHAARPPILSLLLSLLLLALLLLLLSLLSLSAPA